jgi:hypothetical protein
MRPLEGLDFVGMRSIETLQSLVLRCLLSRFQRRRGSDVLSLRLHGALVQLALQIGYLPATFYDLRLEARQG